jgi:hypothetical protein
VACLNTLNEQEPPNPQRTGAGNLLHPVRAESPGRRCRPVQPLGAWFFKGKMKEKFIFTFLLVVLLIGCSKQPNLSTSIPLHEFTPTNMPLTEAPTITATSLPRATLIVMPTFTPLPFIASTPQYTQTADSSVFVNTQHGKQLRSNKYGFIITLPPDIDFMTEYTPDGDVSIFGASLAQKHLDDGGDIVTVIFGSVENQTDSCHPKLIDPDKAVKTEQVVLGGTPFTKVYTPDLYGLHEQEVDYMTYGHNFCVHFSVNLTTYYFDQGDAQPDNMLPYMQDELESIISSFRWIKP